MSIYRKQKAKAMLDFEEKGNNMWASREVTSACLDMDGASPLQTFLVTRMKVHIPQCQISFFLFFLPKERRRAIERDEEGVSSFRFPKMKKDRQRVMKIESYPSRSFSLQWGRRRRERRGWGEDDPIRGPGFEWAKCNGTRHLL